MDLFLRPATAGDAAELAAIYERDREELTTEGRLPSFFTEAGQRERIEHLWPKVRTLGYVVVQRGEIVGLFMFEDTTADEAIIGYYVASAHRRCGIATRALS